MKAQRFLIILAALTIAVSFIGLVASRVSDSFTIQQQHALIGTISSDNDALRDQVQELGERPVAPPAEDRADEQDVAVVTGPEGVAGPRGRDGRTPTSAEVYEVVRQYCASNDCRGPQGIPGINGAAGETVVGPAGADGAPGAAGQPGTTGQPPHSWTYTDALGFTHTCTRTDPFDATAPTYNCN